MTDEDREVDGTIHDVLGTGMLRSDDGGKSFSVTETGACFIEDVMRLDLTDRMEIYAAGFRRGQSGKPADRNIIKQVLESIFGPPKKGAE